MHLTTTEIEILPSAVAAIAIIGGYLGVRSANRSQLRLARDGYERDRLTETYLTILKGVHLRNAQLDDSYARPMDKPPRTPTENDPTTDNEVLFGAQLLAYASPEVDELWGKFALLTTEFDNLLIRLRRDLGMPPKDLKGPNARQAMDTTFDKWVAMRDELKTRIRDELRR